MAHADEASPILTASSVLSSLSLLYPVTLRQGAIIWSSELLFFCDCFLILTHTGVFILCVCFLYFQRWLRILLLQNKR